MNDTPSEQPNAQPSNPDTESEALLRSLRRKEGNWIEWGQACQKLQKAGYSPQQIFEDTGFEPIQQNQIIVASQVYLSMLSVGVADAVQSYFQQKGSDTLYELRILAQAERASAATLIVEKGIDSEGAHDIAKALKDFSRLPSPPAGFSKSSGGDAVAYYYWNLARQQSDLQARSRLIAQALRFATTPTAREQVEKLLTDFTVTPSRSAPLLPFYRLDSEEQLPRILPVVGRLPLTTSDLQAVPLVEEEGPFRMVRFSGTGAWVPLPGWQILLNAEDPVVLLANSHDLPTAEPSRAEEVVVVIDRASRQWDVDSYFILDQDNQIQIQWTETAPPFPILGKVILIMRPKRVLDDEYTKDPWQIDE